PEISDPDYFAALHDGRVGNVMIENDAVLAALAEQHVRGLADTESMISLLIDASVGAGIILDGRAIRGSAGYAGEMSYLPGSGWATAHLDLVDVAARHDVSAEALFEFAGSPHAPVWAEQA
ncbi:ROK family protein, partial [Xanthomonas citri pv. citri]|nr:ROK family protein [Xanthomonas citri pv. citri]